MAIDDFQRQPGLNLLAIYNQFWKGRDEARQNRLADLAEYGRQLQGEVLAGDRNKLGEKLRELARVDPERYTATVKYTDDQKKAATQEFLSAAYAAKTPEAWKSVVDRFKAKGHAFDPGEEDFANRDNLLREGMSVADQMGIDLKSKEFAAEQGRWERQFAADQSYKNAQLGIERQKLAQPNNADLQEYQFAKSQGFQGSFIDFKTALKGGGNELSVTLPDGTSISQGPSKITEGQGKDMSYLNRMLTAAPILDKNDETLTSFGENVAGNAPFGLGNYAKSSQFQQAEQAGRNFLTALLRKESGAQIPPSEERSYGDIFLPRPGDKKEVIAQKREARRQAAIGIKMGLPAPLIKSMIQQGVDFSALNPPADTGQGAGMKSDRAPTREEVDAELRRRGVK